MSPVIHIMRLRETRREADAHMRGDRRASFQAVHALAITVLVVLTGCFPTQPDNSGYTSLRGTVTSPNGSPMPGIPVVAATKSTRTARNGSFAFRQVPSANLTMTVGTSDRGSFSVRGLAANHDNEIRIVLGARGEVLSTEVIHTDDDDSDEQEGKACLTRPTGAPDPDAKGEIEVEKESGNSEEFEIEVENLAADLPIDIFLEDPTSPGNFNNLGPFKTDASGKFKIEYRTAGGLPYSTDIAGLAGLQVRVVEVGGSTPLLVGIVPVLGDDCNGDHHAEEEEGEACLTRPMGASDPDAEGEIEVEKESSGGEEFEIKVKRLAADLPIDIFLEDPSSPGTFNNLGPFKTNAEGKFKIEYRTASGLPYSTDIAGLAGLEVRVVEVGGSTPLLVGVVPVLGDDCDDDDDAQEEEGEACLTRPTGASDPDAKGEIEVEKERNGGEEFEIEVENLAADLPIDIFLEDPANPGTFNNLGPFKTNADGEFEIEYHTAGGLPYSTNIAGLAGLEVKVVEVGGSTPLLVGVVPVLGDDCDD